MKIIRRKTKVIKIGNIYIGGNNPIAIQSMTKTKTSRLEETVGEVKALENVGCEIVRLAVRDNKDAKTLKRIKAETKIPLVADIHFNWRLAIDAIDSGVDKLRLNPGNIYKKDELREIVQAARASHIPIRIGVNSGSLRAKSRELRAKGIAEIMVKETLDYVKILEGFGFYEIVVSLKASNILDTLQTYRKMAKVCDYPLHLGLTATGPSHSGVIKSSIALGSLLLEGIGDTMRISLTDKPQEEVKVAQYILEAVELRSFSPEIISCPTCGRCEVDLVKVVKEFEKKLNTVNCKLLTINSQPVKVAIMGCVVNGPGEAKQSDIGIAFGRKEGLLFRNSKPVKKISVDRCVDVLLSEILKNNKS